MVTGPSSEANKTLQVGTMVGEFQIGEKLGEGGMGVVYAGRHPVIGKRVAVKVLSSYCASNPDLVRRFVEEARAVNKIGHPNIIDIFSFGQLPNGQQYFVMEFLDGQSLADKLEAGDIPVGDLRRLLRQICSALEAAHRVGIIHRDLKPANIWIATPREEESYAKLLDFGIAKLIDLDATKITQTGEAMGSPQFMPPEQCMGQSVDRRADVYAMGVILYRIFSGKLPFEGVTLPQLIYQQTTQAPVPPSHHRLVAADLERIILDCLEKDPDRRPATARALADRLDRALGTESAAPVARATALLANDLSGPATGARPGTAPSEASGPMGTRILRPASDVPATLNRRGASGGSEPTHHKDEHEPPADTSRRDPVRRNRRGWPLLPLAGGIALIAAAGFAVFRIGSNTVVAPASELGIAREPTPLAPKTVAETAPVVAAPKTAPAVSAPKPSPPTSEASAAAGDIPFTNRRRPAARRTATGTTTSSTESASRQGLSQWEESGAVKSAGRASPSPPTGATNATNGDQSATQTAAPVRGYRGSNLKIETDFPGASSRP